MQEQIPPIVKEVLDQAAQQYANSPATTNAGRILRFIAKFLTFDTVAKLFAHKFKQ